MRTRRAFDWSLVWALGLAAALAACAPKPAQPPAVENAQQPSLRIVGRTPLANTLLQNQVVVFFDAPITVEPLPDWPAPIRLASYDKGTSRTGENFVAMDFDKTPPQAVYRVQLSPGIKSQDGRTLADADREFIVLTRPFAPQGVWPASEDATQRLALQFPTLLAPNADSLRERVKVTDKQGNAVKTEVKPQQDPSIVWLEFAGTPEWPVRVEIAPGLVTADGAVTSTEMWSSVYPSDATFAVTDVSWGEVSAEAQSIDIYFTIPVLDKDLAKALTITDREGKNMPTTIEDRGTTSVHRAVIHAPELRGLLLRIAVAQGLPGSEGRALAKPHEATLTYSPPPLAIQSDWWQHGGPEGLKLHLNFSDSVAAPDLKKLLTIEPEVANVRVEPDYGGITIAANWTSKTSYTLNIAPGLKYGPGLVSDDEISYTVKTDEMPAYVNFGLPGKAYLPRRTGGSLPIESRNVQSAKIAVFRMFPSNVAVALNAMQDGRGSSEFNTLWSEPLQTKEAPLKYAPDTLTQTPLELDSLFPADKKGVFGLEVRDAKQGSASVKLILWTNLGVLAHWQDDELAMFVHDLFSLAPVANAKVTVYSEKNQTLAQGATDARGIARVATPNRALGTPRVAVIEAGDDFTFIELRPREGDPTPFTEAMPAYDRAGYDAFLYADRDLYRPGETAHLHWLVRTNYGDALGAVPLVLTVLKPNGRELFSQTLPLSALGTGGYDLETQKTYPTGTYEARLLVPGSEKPLGTYTFRVEEFVPNRIEVNVALPQPTLVSGQEAKLEVNARHLFGAPAQDRMCEAKLVFKRGDAPLDQWKEFRFDNDSDFVPDAFSIGETNTDAQGHATFTFTYSAPKKLTFPLKAILLGRVFELGGRGVTGRAEGVLFPSQTALGVALSPASSPSTLDVAVAAVQPDQSPAPLTSAKVTLERQTWNYYVREYYTHYESDFDDSYEEVETRDVPLNAGRGATSWTINDGGRYRVRVHADETQQYSSMAFEAWGGKIFVSDAKKPQLIKVTLDKSTYTPGETAQVRIESPFDGQAVIVVQHERVLDVQTVPVTGGAGVAAVQVGAEHSPNAWIEATVIHAVQQGRAQMYPFSSVGFAALEVRDAKRALNVAFPGLPGEIRPGTEAEFDVEVRDSQNQPARGEVTLAVVDEGIHGITNYANPDPLAWLQRLRKPDYRRAHYYDKVAYDFAAPAAGGDADLAARMGVSDNTWIRPLALWSGTLTTDDTGHARVKMAFPEFTGQVRLVAVAASQYAMGAQASQMYVRRPYLLRAGLPRFMLPGDTAQCRVAVFNNTDAPCRATLRWTPGGALKPDTGEQTLDIAAHAEASIVAPLTALDAIGQGNVGWEVIAMDGTGVERERFTENTPIPVRAPSAFQTTTELIVLKPGESRDFTQTRFVEDGRASLRLSLSATPLLQLEKALGYAIGYPYGCIEQTISRAMPAFLLRRHADLVTPELLQNTAIDAFVRSGVQKVFSMQTADGGLSTWPNGQDSYPYGSVYGLHFLTLVKQSGALELPEKSLGELQEYVRRIAFSPAEDLPANMGAWPAAAAFLQAYALYVLVLDGDLRAAQQLDRFSNADLPRAGRYLLAAALAQATGDMKRARAYMTSEPGTDDFEDGRGAILSSKTRNTAIELLALVQMKADPKELAARAQTLADFLRQYPHGRTTQESAFVIAALSQYYDLLAAQQTGASAQVSADGKTQTLQRAQVYRGRHDGAGGRFSVVNTGNTVLYAALTSSGVPAQPDTSPVSKNMTIERHVYTAKGEEITAGAFKQAEAYIVAIQVKPAGDAAVDSVVIEDPLPAGFEVENPRLQADALPGSSFPEPATPDFLEVRDDRVAAMFSQIDPGEPRWFYYVVRATTPGRYQQPAARAEGMYDPDYAAATAPGTVEVTE